MYKTHNGSNDLFKELAQNAMLTNLFYILIDWDKCGLKVNNTFYESEFEFVPDLKNHPETIRLLIELNKERFLYEVADSDFKPKSWTPEEYMHWYIKTFEFICDDDVLAPCVEDWTPFEKKYGEEGKAFNRIELILYICFESLFEDDYVKETYNHCKSYITDKKSFIKVCKEMFELFSVDEKIAEEYIPFYIQEAKDLKREIIKEGTPRNEIQPIFYYYKMTFEWWFYYRNVPDTFMYDNDFFFYYEGWNDKQIIALG